MSVWKRLQRVGKSASKFQFTASYQELVVECTKKWQVTVLFIILFIGYVYCIQWPIRCLVIERPLSHLPSFWNLYACIFGHYWCYSLPFWFFFFHCHVIQILLHLWILKCEYFASIKATKQAVCGVDTPEQAKVFSGKLWLCVSVKM